LKKCKAKQWRTEFPDKRWRASSINRLLKKFRHGHSGQSHPTPHRTGSFQGHSQFIEVNKYAFKKLAIFRAQCM